jgi:hypothetical protein
MGIAKGVRIHYLVEDLEAVTVQLNERNNVDRALHFDAYRDGQHLVNCG